MEQKSFQRIEKNLQDVPKGTLVVEHHFDKNKEKNLFTESFQTTIIGKGKMTAYQIFPGIQLSLNYYHSEQAGFHHDSHAHILEINHCRLGRVGWDFHNGSSVYLGPGDLALHSMEYCADSEMTFPLGYCESLSVSLDLAELKNHPLPILRETSIDLEQINRTFCRSDKSVALPFSSAINGIFSPMYAAPEEIRLPYFKLKIQELLLYLGYLDPQTAGLTQYCSRQTATVKEIHALLTEHLDQRYTIEELSKKFLINTSSLKEVFKGVYGLPIATYMKEYRIHKGIEMLKQTDDSIAEIAAKLGYETQGKFTKAFKDTVKMTPTAYRKMYLH
ncbi:MAG TPA: AraC family transcriptional regulator [Candidatus Blautia intestinigallinarum]|uniref:helix-turn-helix domain-containing protein n=1 Tax=Anaerostipes sp. TaxID=1872530 RepID=UPI001F945797|nr:AraC family transcriptional regulator [Anaerostipes sp.]HIV35425.1 AraC family transcriptional regulator [Candidatus Blautia intestinigallinarum]